MEAGIVDEAPGALATPTALATVTVAVTTAAAAAPEAPVALATPTALATVHAAGTTAAAATSEPPATAAATATAIATASVGAIATASPGAPDLIMEDATVCAAGGHGDHELRGENLWHAQRAHWLRKSLDEMRCGAQSDASPTDACESSSEHNESVSSLSELERVNLRGVLSSTDSPYPPLRRTVPLSEVVRCAVELWNDDDDDTLGTRLAKAARATTFEVVEKTMNWGSSIARWSQGVVDSLSASPSATPTTPKPYGVTPRSHRASGATPCGPGENKDATLRNALRSRGGIKAPSSNSLGDAAAGGARQCAASSPTNTG